MARHDIDVIREGLLRLRDRCPFLIRIAANGFSRVGEIIQLNLLVGLSLVLSLVGGTAIILVFVGKFPTGIWLALVLSWVIIEGAFIEDQRKDKAIACLRKENDQHVLAVAEHQEASKAEA